MMSQTNFTALAFLLIMIGFIFKVILCYNVKAAHYFANPHMTGLCLYGSI